MNPIASFTYFNPRHFARNETGQIVSKEIELPIYLDNMPLPDGLDALIVTSDLQGTVMEGGEHVLMGVKVPTVLLGILQDQGIDPVQTGVFLCGDLYAHKRKRGGYGDVSGVWRAFNREFAWVAGVQGNHDHFGSKENKWSLVREKGINLLENRVVELAGHKVAGVGLVIGNPQKPNRLTEETYIRNLQHVLGQDPDWLILHAAPYLDQKHLGEPAITEVLTQHHNPNMVVFCGHEPWEKSSTVFANGVSFVNADERVIIFRASEIESN